MLAHACVCIRKEEITIESYDWEDIVVVNSICLGDLKLLLLCLRLVNIFDIL